MKEQNEEKSKKIIYLKLNMKQTGNMMRDLKYILKTKYKLDPWEIILYLKMIIDTLQRLNKIEDYEINEILDRILMPIE